ncbi:MAG: hypothetical protein J6X02_00205 [Bacilli bacterium]|nr:hypothetical protein [Bacilli bacterium]
MTLQETRNKIKEIQESTKDYQDSINNVQTKLLNLIDDTNKIKKAITTEIKEESIATHSVSSSKKTVNKINKALGKSRSTLDTL